MFGCMDLFLACDVTVLYKRSTPSVSCLVNIPYIFELKGLSVFNVLKY